MRLKLVKLSGRKKCSLRIMRTESEFVKLWAEMKRPPFWERELAKPEDRGPHIAQKVNDTLLTNVTDKDRLQINHFLEYFPLRANFKRESVTRLGAGLKKKGGTFSKNVFAKCFTKICPAWHEKLFILTSEGFGYSDDLEDKNLKDSIFLDRSLQIKASKLCTKDSLTFIVRTSNRKLKMKVQGILAGFCWLESFTKAVSECKYCCIHKFNSFAPIVDCSMAKWYINGQTYFEDVADAMEKAASKIYITDWMLSPGMYLKRPVHTTHPRLEFRLDQILLRAANRGVKVFILLYKEFEHALPNNSKHAMEYLQKLHKNISVMRHPQDLIMLWSHHEKMVAVDCVLGFMGGLDLCYGRYDTGKQYLCEPHLTDKEIHFPGQDYNNVRLKDFKNVQNWDLTLIDKSSQPRMPWRDIGIQLRGEVVKDLARHFIQYWNFASVQATSKKDGGHLARGSTLSAPKSAIEKYTKNPLDEIYSSDEEEMAPVVKQEGLQPSPVTDPNTEKNPLSQLKKMRQSFYELTMNPEFHMMRIEQVRRSEDEAERHKVEEQLAFIAGHREEDELEKNNKNLTNYIRHRKGSAELNKSKDSLNNIHRFLNSSEYVGKQLDLKPVLESPIQGESEMIFDENTEVDSDLAKLLVESILHEE